MEERQPLKDRTVLVTGGRGFIRSALSDRLEKEGTKVISVDSKEGLDICDLKQLTDVAKDHRIESIYHLAALSYVPYSWEHPHEVYQKNITGTLNVLELCRQQGISKTVQISSYVYGRPQYLPVDEDHPIYPASPYNWSKFIGEKLCEAYSRDFGIDCVVLRPFNIYGIGQNPDFLIPTIIDQVFKGDEVVLADLRPKRDYLYLDDMIEALINAGNYSSAGIDFFNIGYGKSYSVGEIVDEIARIAGKKVTVKCLDQQRKGEILDVVADIGKAEGILKWRPQIDLAEGLSKIWSEVSAKS
jgi:UDP-glucose 4-epimerase